MVHSGIMQGWKEKHPQHFFYGLGTVIVHLDTVFVSPLFHFRRMNPGSFKQVVAPIRCPDIGEITVTMAGQIGVLLQHLGKNGSSGARQTRDINRPVDHPMPGFLANNDRFEVSDAFPDSACGSKKPGLKIQTGRNTDAAHGGSFQNSRA